MKKFTIVLLALVSLASISARAQSSEKNELFSDMKTHVLGMLDKRIASLQEEKACVTQAQNKEDMKKCRKEHEEHKTEMKADREEFRESMKKKREGMKKARKEKKESSGESNE